MAGSNDGRPASRATGAPAPGAGTRGRELRARGQRTLARLLEAGTEVFARRGYHAARVDDVVAVARTSHGTFYLYFANKEDLFRALATEVAERLVVVAAALPGFEPGDRGRAALRDWLGEFSQLYERSGPVIRAWTEAEIGGDEFGRLGTELWGEFTRVLATRIADAGPPGLDPTAAAIAIAAMIERSHYYVLAGHVDVTPEAMLDTLASVVHAGLFGSVSLAR